jgi:heterodisulfide reductase subunit A
MARKKGESKEKGSNSVLVVGSGMAGMRAALDLAESGVQVHLIDRGPNLGGLLMQLDRQFPTNDCGICKMLPTMMRDNIGESCIRRNLSHPNIKVYTNTTVEEVNGKAGDFYVKLIQKPLFVDPENCIFCGKCEDVCPVEIPNEFNDNLDTRKAIFTPYPLPNPSTYTLDIDNCTKCGECVKICPTDAISLDAKQNQLQLNIGSIILAPGLHVFDPEPNKAYGYGTNPNILTSIDFERIYSGLGPYSGHRTILRPSDKNVPKSMAFIQCVGSRDTQFGHEYCSFACCMYSLKEAMLAKEQHPEMDITIYFMDMRAFGKGYHQYYEQAKKMGINFVRSRVPAVQSISGSDDLELTLVSESGELLKKDFEMVVLGVGLEAPSDAENLAKIFDIRLNEHNFNESDEFTPVASSRDGVFVCGGFNGPKDIPETVTEASAAAVLAAQNLKLPQAKPENEQIQKGDDITSSSDTLYEQPKIGVLLCSCGDEIDSQVNLNELADFCKSLPDVEVIDTMDYLCLNPEPLKNKIRDQNIIFNRLIIAACSPYPIEVKFKQFAHDLGINPAGVEIIDLRTRICWVCENDNTTSEENTNPTSLAKRLISIAHSKLYSQEQLPTEPNFEQVTHRALVVGGGISGLTAAISIANTGFPVDLIELSDTLGGNLKDIYSTLAHENIQDFLKNLEKAVSENENINVLLNSSISEITGYVGNFKTKIQGNDADLKEEEYGVVIIATGAGEYKPTEFSYGQNPRVLTQLEFEQVLSNKKLDDAVKEKLIKDKASIDSVAMIQCVGSRNSEHPYCSRVCCSKAIKNALKLKKQNPKAKIYIIYQDIMTYGLMEKYYLEAREVGIEFLRYEPDNPPKVSFFDEESKVILKVRDIILNQEIDLEPDLLVLSTGIIPNKTGLDIFDNIGMEFTNDGFLKEANVKFRPVDMLADGVFIAGLAHSPRLITESIVQAQATAGRALTILSKPVLPIRRNVSEVHSRKCSGCELCINTCPYHARILNPDEKIAMVIEPLCQACGVCTMVCPNAAAKIRGFKRDQIFSMIDSAVE